MSLRRLAHLPMVALAAALSVVALAPLTQGSYDTDWDDPFLYECYYGDVLKSLYSVHSNRREDRIWDFSCAGGPNGASPTDCKWSDYVNNFDAAMNFMCPTNSVVCGVQSFHSNSREDRRFQFRCYEHDGYKTHPCSQTGYVNDWDGVLDYTVPSGEVLVGVASVHSNQQEDRRYKFTTCQYDHL